MSFFKRENYATAQFECKFILKLNILSCNLSHILPNVNRVFVSDQRGYICKPVMDLNCMIPYIGYIQFGPKTGLAPVYLMV